MNIARKLHKDRAEIINFCASHSRIYLYGKGVVGEFIYRYLLEEGISIEAVIVTEKSEGSFLWHGLCVKALDEISPDESDGIILGMSNALQKEVYDELCRRGVASKQLYCQNIYSYNCHEFYMNSPILTEKYDSDNSYFSEYKVLNSIGIECRTDKASYHHNYLNKYEFFLEKWKEQRIAILELGVFKGGSIQMWSEYFSNAQIIGVDIDEKCKKYEGQNKKVRIQDLGDEEKLEELASINPTVIIDDASHFCSHQIKALYHLLPSLKSGGVYILEDVDVCFSAYRSYMYQDSVISTFEFLKMIAEIVCSNEHLAIQNVDAKTWVLKDEIEYLASQIEMISFIQRSCIIVKK